MQRLKLASLGSHRRGACKNIPGVHAKEMEKHHEKTIPDWSQSPPLIAYVKRKLQPAPLAPFPVLSPQTCSMDPNTLHRPKHVGDMDGSFSSLTHI